jgi:hypothetical protein
MRIRRPAAQLGLAIIVLAGTAWAQLYAPPAEFKCMGKTSKAGSKFIASKAKCVTKCIQTIWKGIGDPSDCFAPYGGSTLVCIADSLKGVEAKFALAIRGACDPTFKLGTACPSCYSGGDCGPSGEALDRVANFENQIDSFFPGLYCQVTPPPFHLQMDCQVTATKGVVKYFAKINRCYDKCYGLVEKGIIPAASCAPPASDPIAMACLADARAATVKYIDHDCHPPPAQPDGCGAPYPTAEDWADLTEVMTNGGVTLTYCASPSGAFLD